MATVLKSLMVTLAAGLLTAGCAGVTRNALPAELASKAEVPGIPGVRAWGSDYSPLFQADLVESAKQARGVDPRGVVGPDGYANVLALSGGGPDGAFGAGLLCGWTKAGTRPTFKLVTGMSTGALIAPFAFVGPEYDHVLKQFYTTLHTKDIFTPKSLTSLLEGTDSLADSTPLAALLEKVVDDKQMAAVADGHRKGRRIYTIATRDGIDFKMAHIPDDYERKATEMFDPADMARLFDMAFDMAKAGYPWMSLPPGLKERTTKRPAG
ncbi:MAG: patatin-like phospholipase family protein [Phycisphaerae bacterium]